MEIREVSYNKKRAALTNKKQAPCYANSNQK